MEVRNTRHDEQYRREEINRNCSSRWWDANVRRSQLWTSRCTIPEFCISLCCLAVCDQIPPEGQVCHLLAKETGAKRLIGLQCRQHFVPACIVFFFFVRLSACLHVPRLNFSKLSQPQQVPIVRLFVFFVWGGNKTQINEQQDFWQPQNPFWESLWFLFFKSNRTKLAFIFRCLCQMLPGLCDDMNSQSHIIT